MWPRSCGGRQGNGSTPFHPSDPMPNPAAHQHSLTPLRLETWPGDPQKLEGTTVTQPWCTVCMCALNKGAWCGVYFRLGRSIRLHSLENRGSVEMSMGKQLPVETGLAPGNLEPTARLVTPALSHPHPHIKSLGVSLSLDPSQHLGILAVTAGLLMAAEPLTSNLGTRQWWWLGAKQCGLDSLVSWVKNLGHRDYRSSRVSQKSRCHSCPP